MKLIHTALALVFALGLLSRSSSAGELGAKLSISITNRYGDVLTNLTVSKILSDGLVLEHKAGQLKLRYEELPQELREKYQPLAAAAENRDRQDAAANAAFAAAQHRTQEEHATMRRLQQQQPSPPLDNLRIEVPKEGWGITVLNPNLREVGKQMNESQFVYEAIGRNGFILSIFVEKPSVIGQDNSDVFKFYWSKASRNPTIDPKSVKGETNAKFVKVSYRSLGIPNANYYFAFHGRWVDVHISKSMPAKDDAELFAAFEESLSYGE